MITINNPNAIVEQLPAAQALMTVAEVAQTTGTGGAAVWGQITGNILNQIDLQQQFALQAGIAQANLSAHTSNHSNPHTVTAAQVGLGNVANLSPDNLPVSLATAAAIATVAATVPSIPLAVNQGGTGAVNAANARTNLGATAVGSAVFQASTQAAARGAIGSGTFGDQLFLTASQAAALTLLGIPTSGRLLATTVYNASGSHVPNALTARIEYEVVGGGGAGGGAVLNGAALQSIGAAGMSGGYVHGYTTTIATQTITIGVGGARVTGGTGGNGGDSSYGAIAIARGGSGGIQVQYISANGVYSGAYAAFPAANVDTGTSIVNVGGTQSPGLFLSSNVSSYGQMGTPGPWGGAPGIVGQSSGNDAGANNGAGGSGSAQGANLTPSQQGGAGGSGKIIIREYS